MIRRPPRSTLFPTRRSSDLERVRKKVPPGPDNPLGEYWMGLSATCCGIHSTNAPQSVYQFKTHGCVRMRSEEHTSELQSQSNLVCRLLLEKKKKNKQ